MLEKLCVVEGLVSVVHLVPYKTSRSNNHHNNTHLLVLRWHKSKHLRLDNLESQISESCGWMDG